MNILTKIIDSFKAKNPAAWSKIQTALGAFQLLLILSISFSTQLLQLQDVDKLLDYLPFLEGFFKFLESVPTMLAGVLSGTTWVLEKLIGSSTPGSTVPVRMLDSNGEIAFVKKKEADRLLEERKAIKLPVAK